MTAIVEFLEAKHNGVWAEIVRDFLRVELRKDLTIVAISIGLQRGRGWKGKRYLALAPTREMLKMPSEDYDRL